MVYKIATLFAVLALFVVGAGADASAQTLTFQGTQICFNFGGVVQCHYRGTISGFAMQRDRAFESRQAGAAVGSLVGILIAAWLNHRHEVKLETEQLSKELQEYVDAESQLVQDELTMESEDQGTIILLEQLDPSRKAGWERQLDSSKGLYEKETKYLSDLKGLLAVQMKEKRKKAMEYFVNHDPDGAKPRYARQRKTAAQAYVVNLFLKALVDSYRQNPPKVDEEKSVSTILIQDGPCVPAMRHFRTCCHPLCGESPA